MRLHELPKKLYLLIVLQLLLGAVLLPYVPLEPLSERWPLLGFLALCGWAGGSLRANTGPRLGYMTLGFAVTAFAMLVLGPAGAVVVGLAATIAGSLKKKDSLARLDWQRVRRPQFWFNLANSVAATTGMGMVYWVSGGRPGHAPFELYGLPILAAVAAYYLINVGGVTLAISWTSGIAPLQVYRGEFSWTWPGFLGGAGLSAALLWLHNLLGLGTPIWLIGPPALMVWCLHRTHNEKAAADAAHMRELNRLNEAVIGSLAMAIEAKDPNTRSHVNRVREYAVRLGQALGVSESDLESIRIAALLHDIGKIGIPEQILCKQGKLTADEYEIVKSHVDLGAALLEQVKFPWPVVPVVRSHHEKWDGTGYPLGLKGEEIPIGGRVIALVDVFDAITSERPYRKAMTRDEAIAMIRQQSGRHFDPHVVETFIRELPNMEAAVGGMDSSAETSWLAVLESFEKRRQIAEPPQDPCDEIEDARALQSLADLDRHGNSLQTLAPALLHRLEEMIPASTLTLFMVDPDERLLRPACSTGLWLELLEGMEIRVGEGASGVVAATGEPLVNASAALDLARRVRPGENLELNSVLAVPVRVGDSVLGVLAAYHTSYGVYRQRHLLRLTRAAECLAELLSGFDAPAELMLLRDDPVTGLPSSGSLLQFLYGQITVASIRQEEFAVALFRLVPTEPLEPATRNALLGLLAGTLRDAVRDGDFLARHAWPGMEPGLGLVLPRCGERQASSILCRVRRRMEVDAEALAGQKVGLEIVLRLYPRDGRSAPHLLDRPPQIAPRGG